MPVVAHPSIKLIERYALRQLSEVEIQQVNRHVASCPECENRLKQVAAMRSSTVAEFKEIVKA